MRSFGSKQSLRLPSAIQTGNMELVHSVCSWTGVMIPSMQIHCPSSLDTALILTGTDRRGVEPVHSSSSVWFGILFLGAFLLCWTHHYVLSVCPLLWWLICVSTHLWVLHHWAAGPSDISDLLTYCLLPWCFHPYCLQVCMCIWLLCLPWWGNLQKVYIPYLPHNLSTKNQVPSGIHNLEHGFPWHLASSEEFCCAQPCMEYWLVTISSNDCHRWFCSLSSPQKLICRCTGAWCCTLLWCQLHSQSCGPVPWDMLLTTVVWCACCPPACWGYSLVPSSCGGTSLSAVLFVDVGCVVLHVAVTAMSLLLLVPSGHGLLPVSAFFSHPLLCPLPSLPSMTCNYPWSVHGWITSRNEQLHDDSGPCRNMDLNVQNWLAALVVN